MSTTAAIRNTLTRDEQKELVQRAIDGDEQAFNDLYLRYKARVRHAILRVVSTEDIEDVMQMAWLRIYSKLSLWNGTAEFSTWIHRVAFNCALMFLRARKNDRKNVSLEEPPVQKNGNESIMFEPSFEEKAYATVGDIDKMREAIARLPDLMRVVTLMHNNGSSNGEIVAATGLTLGNVKSYLHRLPGRLREEMGVDEITVPQGCAF